MRTSAEQRRLAEQRIRAASDALLRGDIPSDGKCDITTLARQSGSPAPPFTALTRT